MGSIAVLLSPPKSPKYAISRLILGVVSTHLSPSKLSALPGQSCVGGVGPASFGRRLDKGVSS